MRVFLAMAAACCTLHAAAADSTRVALVVQDQTALRAAPRDAAPAQALLWRGDSVELRAERGDHVQVWDHRRERGGYVRKSQLLPLAEGAGATTELLAQLRLARRQIGTEALGLGLAAAYVQAATAAELTGASGAEVLDAMGELAERLADRASVQSPQNPQPSKSADALLAAQLDVAARYGMHFVNVEAEDGRVQVCYDGDAFRRVLAVAATPEQRLRAALTLTRPDCGSPRATPKDIEARDVWRAGILGQIDASRLPVAGKNRLLMRRAAVQASLAFALARRDASARPAPVTSTAAAGAASMALTDFASIVPAELSDDDQPLYNDAAMRVNAARWIAQPATISSLAGLALSTEPGADGDTCVLLRDGSQAGGAGQASGAVLARRCTWGLVALASASRNRESSALALSVQPLDGWRELWVFVKVEGGWRVEVLPPAAAQPGIGFAEFAGWVPGGKQMLVAREARAEGRYKRSFELLSLATLATERQASDAKALGPFQRWADPGWLQASLSRR
jgi:hypothetical protein